MSDRNAEPEGLGLQFDRFVRAGASPGEGTQPAVVCAGCQHAIETEYFDINGNNFCGSCREAVEAAAETPRGLGVLMRAALFGAGAAVVGALIYYGVLAIAHLEVGLIAILSGYMVGLAVRKGARGRGGLRFQILAVLLTYLSVALAYSPLVVQGMMRDARERKAQAVATSHAATAPARRETVSSTDASTQTAPKTGMFRFLFAIVLLAGLLAALPVMVVLGGLPFSLISGLIIGFGMRQAWRMTGTQTLMIFGPYRVGTTSTASTP